jgi:hypothetical protein
MIQLSSEVEMFCYNNVDELLNNIEKDFGRYGNLKDIRVTSFMMNGDEYKYALEFENVYDVWFYFNFYTL